jgi:hypothetical protein
MPNAEIDYNLRIVQDVNITMDMMMIQVHNIIQNVSITPGIPFFAGKASVNTPEDRWRRK